MQPGPANHSNSNRLIWLSALQVEIEPILSLLDRKNSICVAGFPGWHGFFHEREMYVFTSGGGAKSCQQALAALLDQWQMARILNVGLAGALNPILNVGDVVVTSRSMSWKSTDESFHPGRLILGARANSHTLRYRADRNSPLGFKTLSGSILSWDELVQDDHLKRELYKRYRADCVDMETGYAVQTCEQRGSPFLGIRGISDLADGCLDQLSPTHLSEAVWHATLVALHAIA